MTTSAATAEDTYFEVKPGTKLDYLLCLGDWLNGDTLSTATWTARDATQVTVVSSSINSNQTTITYDDGTTKTFAIGEVTTGWLLFAAALEAGDIAYVDIEFETANSPSRIDTRTLEFRVVSRYSR